MSKWAGIDEFLAVAASSSFTAAARALGKSPTHVSRSILALELRLGAQLFYRTTRTVGLTDAGRVFLDRCERIAQETDEAIDLMRERGEPQGELRVTCSTALGERFVVPLIRRFATKYAKLSVSIELTNRIVDLVGEGFDLAIRTGQITDSRLIGTKIAARNLLTCAAPGYIAKAGRPTELRELAGHECIIGTSERWIYRVNGQCIDYRPNGRFRCNNGHAVMEVCISGFGICQLPDFYVEPYISKGMVEVLLENMQPAEDPVWAVYPRRRHLSPKINLLVENLRCELMGALRPAVSDTDIAI